MTAAESNVLTHPRERVRANAIPYQWIGNLVQPTQPLYLIQDVIPRTGFALMYGQHGSGKSFLALHIAFCVALGKPFFSRPVERGGVLYFALEGAAGIRVRVAAAKLHDPAIGTANIALVDRAIHLRGEGNHLDELMRTVHCVREDLKERGVELRLIIIDTFARALNGADENASAPISEMINAFDLIGKESGAAVLVVGHSGKNHQQGHRGHSSTLAACDTAWEVKARHDQITVECVKNKDGPGEMEFAFRLREVAIATNEQGDESTSCVVEELSAAPRREARSHPLDKQILDVLRKASVDSGAPDSENPNGEACSNGRLRRRALMERLSSLRTENQSESAWKKQVNRRIAGLRDKEMLGCDEARQWFWLRAMADKTNETPSPAL